MWIERAFTFWHSYEQNVITPLETWWKSQNTSFQHSSDVLLWVCWGWEQKYRDSAFDFWRYRTSPVLLRHTVADSAVFACLLRVFLCVFWEGNIFFFCDVCKYLTLRYDGTHFVILIFSLMWYSESQFQCLYFWFEDRVLASISRGSDESVIVEFAKRRFTSSCFAIRGGWDVEECFAPPLSRLMVEWERPKFGDTSAMLSDVFFAF